MNLTLILTLTLSLPLTRLAPGGLFVLGTHCVDNSPTPQASQAFVSTLPGVGAARANDALACMSAWLTSCRSLMTIWLIAE